MKKLLSATMSIFLVASAYGQKHTVQTFEPKPLPATSINYDTDKPILIGREGVYVCPEGWSMYAADSKAQNATPFSIFQLMPEKSRLITTDSIEYLPLCVQFKEGKAATK
jgi:hypothetical protein